MHILYHVTHDNTYLHILVQVTHLVLDSTIACVLKGVRSTLTISTSSISLTTSSFVVTLVLFDEAVAFVDLLSPDDLSDFVLFHL